MKFIIVKLLRVYQFIISPLIHPSCRYDPTCSQYMIDAVEKKGIVWGVCLGIWRVLGVIPLAGRDTILSNSIFSKKNSVK